MFPDISPNFSKFFKARIHQDLVVSDRLVKCLFVSLYCNPSVGIVVGIFFFLKGGDSSGLGMINIKVKNLKSREAEWIGLYFHKFYFT